MPDQLRAIADRLVIVEKRVDDIDGVVNKVEDIFARGLDINTSRPWSADATERAVDILEWARNRHDTVKAASSKFWMAAYGIAGAAFATFAPPAIATCQHFWSHVKDWLK